MKVLSNLTFWAVLGMEKHPGITGSKHQISEAAL